MYPREAHMYSWFIDLYFPCTGYNPIFMHTFYFEAPMLHYN